MAEVKWIKLSVNMFDNSKIKFIRSLPNGNEVLLIWIMLLTTAGKCNAQGYIFLTENIPYTLEMIADEFRMPINTVRLAVETFIRLNMIEHDDCGLCISGWEEHQNLDALQKMRDQTKQRVARHREKKKLLIEPSNCNVTVTQECNEGNAIDIDIDKDIDIDIDINNIYIYIFDHWNSKKIICHKKLVRKIQTTIKSALKDYSNEEIVQAIDNYHTILISPEYYWTHKWTLEEFLKRGIDKFLDFDIAANNYKSNIVNKGGSINGGDKRSPGQDSQISEKLRDRQQSNRALTAEERRRAAEMGINLDDI